MAGLAVHLVPTLAEGAFVQLAQAVGADEVLGVVLAPGGCDAAAGDGVPAAMAHAALPLVEVQLTVGTALQFEEGAVGEAAQAVRADKALRMPDALQGRQVVVRQWPLTALALGGEEDHKVLEAVGFPTALMETIISKHLPAVGAEEVLGVPGLVHGGEDSLADGASAVGAAWGEGLVVVLLAVRLPPALKEGPSAQLLPAAGTGEVLGVPGFT